LRSKKIIKFKETEIGMIPEDWEVTELQEISRVIDSAHQTPEYSDVGFSMVRVTDIKKGFLDLKNTLKVTKEVYEEFTKNHRPQKNDIIMSRVGTYGISSLVRTEEPFCLGQNTLVIHSPEKFEYIFHALNSKYVKQQIEEKVVGSTQKTISLKNIRELLIPIPTNVNELEQITKILSDLNLMIWLLGKQNQILEKIIQTIFKSWFVNFDGQTEFVDSELGPIPKGWKVIQLENLVELIKGVSYRSEDLQTSNNALVTLKSINRGGGYTKRGLKEYSGKFKDSQILTPGSLVIAQTDVTQTADVLGKPAIIQKSDYENLIASLDLVIAKPKDERITKSFLYYLLINENFQIYAYGHATGTTVLHLSKDAIPSYSFPLPPTKLMKTFDQISKNILEKLDFNQQLSYGLEKIRDSLLPKLMSGELRV